MSAACGRIGPTGRNWHQNWPPSWPPRRLRRPARTGRPRTCAMALSLTSSRSTSCWREEEDECGGSREVRDRDGAPALPRVPGRGRAVQPCRRDRAPLLPDQPGGAERPHGRQRRGVLRGHDAGCLGVGHVPACAFREECTSCYIQGRERRGTGEERPPDSRAEVAPVRVLPPAACACEGAGGGYFCGELAGLGGRRIHGRR